MSPRRRHRQTPPVYASYLRISAKRPCNVCATQLTRNPTTGAFAFARSASMACSAIHSLGGVSYGKGDDSGWWRPNSTGRLCERVDLLLMSDGLNGWRRAGRGCLGDARPIPIGLSTALTNASLRRSSSSRRRRSGSACRAEDRAPALRPVAWGRVAPPRTAAEVTRTAQDERFHWLCRSKPAPAECN
jgi:hypothetical protein